MMSSFFMSVIFCGVDYNSKSESDGDHGSGLCTCYKQEITVGITEKCSFLTRFFLITLCHVIFRMFNID